MENAPIGPQYARFREKRIREDFSCRPAAEPIPPNRFFLRDYRSPRFVMPQTNVGPAPLYRNATQTVFGRGPKKALIMAVGETPGDREDLAGKPFVGPAGKLLDEALAAAGIDRPQVYLTNAVKHFKWEPQGKRRLHKKPSATEQRACRPWLDAEIAVVRPKVILCLGATAAQALLGKQFRITVERGRVKSASRIERVIATYHPAAVLRAPNGDARELMRRELFADVRLAVESAELP